MQDAFAGMQSLHGSNSIGGRHAAEDHRGACLIPPLRTREPSDRSRPGWIDGTEEKTGLLLMGTVTNFATTAEEYLTAEQQKDLVRLVTAGSVDDGKSTLIGRLLYASQSVYEINYMQ